MMAASPAVGQERPVAWVAAPPGRAVPVGGTATVRLTATIDTGWHLYSITQGPGGPIPTRIALAPGQSFVLADSVRGPAATRRFDPNFGIDVETYEGAAAFALRVRVGPGARLGTDTVAIKARYQACNATLCLPPRTETIPVPLTVGHAARADAGGGRVSAASTTAG
jgi:Disulphide bond corrector protein DsbC